MEKENTLKKTPAQTRKNILVIVLNLLAMVAVVALLPYLALLWVDSYTNHDETRSVPDVCGVPLEEAIATLGAEKLDYTVIERRYQENAAENEVIMQHPEEGSQVKEGRKIGLVINTSVKPKRSVPSVIDNRTYREAESHILAAGFVIESVETVPGEKDWVYELRYNGKQLVNGEAIPQGSALTVVIGSGEEKPDETPVFDTNFDI
jgi:beta-lactam-binding protein with PASTA domain